MVSHSYYKRSKLDVHNINDEYDDIHFKIDHVSWQLLKLSFKCKSYLNWHRRLARLEKIVQLRTSLRMFLYPKTINVIIESRSQNYYQRRVMAKKCWTRTSQYRTGHTGAGIAKTEHDVALLYSRNKNDSLMAY